MFSDNIKAESCLLSQTDSITASGLLCKSNFVDKEDENAQPMTAHQLASLSILTKSLYSQWFKGDDFGLRILSLPNKINSWLTCPLQNQPQKE